MYYESIEISMDEALRKRLRTTRVLLLSIGGLGVLLPQIISITLSLLIASLLIPAGLVVAYFTWHSYNRSALAWLKPFVLITLGLLGTVQPDRRSRGARLGPAGLFPNGWIRGDHLCPRLATDAGLGLDPDQRIGLACAGGRFCCRLAFQLTLARGTARRHQPDFRRYRSTDADRRGRSMTKIACCRSVSDGANIKWR